MTDGLEHRLSFSQEQLWFLQRFGEGLTAYNQPRVLRLRGTLHAGALERAFRAVIGRHAVLRTRFFEQDGAPLGVTLPAVPFTLDRHDLSSVEPSARQERLAALVQETARHLFDLGTPPGLVARLIALSADEHVLAICTHHIVSDAWSTPIIAHDLSAAYHLALGTDDDVRLAPLAMQYADHAVAQRTAIEAGEHGADLSYWNDYLGPETPPLDLVTDHVRPSLQTFAGASRTFTLDPSLDAALRAFCARERSTPFIVLLAAWQVLLARESGQRDFAIGVPHAGRSREELFDLVGFFVNTLVHRVRIDAHMTLRQVCRQVRADALAALAHADLPFELLLAARGGQRDGSRSPIFQAFFGAQTGEAASLALDGLSVEVVEGDEGGAKFELSLNMEIAANEVRGRLTYNSDLFGEATGARLVEGYRRVLALMVREPDTLVASVTLIDDVERDRVVTWGRGEAPAASVPVHDTIAAHAVRTPEAAALACGEAVWSYASVVRSADALAAQLVVLGVGREVRVGIAAERSIAWAIGAIAVLRAGGVFVPLDPALPEERLDYQVEDSGAALVLRAAEVSWTPRVRTLPLAPVETTIEPPFQSAIVHGDQAAYVIYTSGSTGRPKGVIVSHGSLASYARAVLDRMRLPESVRSLAMVSTVAADLGHTVLFGALCAGRTLHLLPADCAFEPRQFAAYMRSHAIDVVKMTPSHLQALLEGRPADAARDVLPRHLLVLGGEATTWPLLQRIAALDPDLRVLNHYGPTETTVGILTQDATTADRGAATLPIGRPIAGGAAYVLDADLNLVPAGAAGELYLAGAGLARGYQGRAALTAARFVANPFDTCGGRLYRTGDRVRWRSDGQVEYLGRLDAQVKIRGFRVELGEIEARLLAQPGVRDAIVVMRDGPQGARLIAYVSAADGVQEPALRAPLARELPDYMVPARIVVLPGLPLTPNGKVDRRALPEPDWTGDVDYDPPQGETETRVAALWADALGVARVGRRDNFFALGGHSLLALHLLERLRQAGFAAAVRTLFRHPELAAFVSALSAHGETGASAAPETPDPESSIPVGCEVILPSMVPLTSLDDADLRRIESTVPGGARNIQDIYPLAPLQEGILFHHVLQRRGDAYVTARALGFDTRARLDHFVDAFNQVMARHDILRTAVVWEGVREPVQVVYRHAPLRVEWLDVNTNGEARSRDAGEGAGETENISPIGSRLGVKARLAAHVHPSHYRIDVQQAPLIRAIGAYDADEQRWLLQLARHHLVSDHTTLDLVVREIELIEQGRAHELSAPVPFRRFVTASRADAARAGHEAFFRDMLGDVDEPTAPFNLLDVQGDGTRLVRAHRALDAALAARIRLVAQQQGVSAATLFHLAWALVLARTSGRDDVVFGTVLFGRLDARDGADRALGMFINTLPLRIRLGARSVRESVRETHAALADLLQHEHASLSLAQRASALPGGTPLFSALLNYRYGRADNASRTTWHGVDVLEGEERTNYPFVLSVDDLGEAFSLTALIHESIDAQRVCNLTHDAIAGIVHALTEAPSRPVCSLPLTASEDLPRLREWGIGESQASAPPPLHRQFEQRAAERPHAPAVIAGETTVTYDALNRRANRLARHLASLGAGPEWMVGIVVERSVEMIVSLLAVLKAGATYVPLDPGYPADRLAYMIEDSGLRVLLTTTALQARLSFASSCTAVTLDAVDLPLADDNLPGPTHAGQLAYVIYTSGSTGRPKGVAVAHGPLAMHVEAIARSYGATADDCELQLASMAFDIAHERWLVALTHGASSVLWDVKQQTAADLVDEIRHRAVTSIFMPPAYASELTSVLESRGARLALRLCVVGGEAWLRDAVTRTRRVLDAERLINAYGPTEAVVAPTQWPVADDIDGYCAPIGRPVGRRTAWVLDEALNLVPIGAPGELYLGGEGLARGYHARAAATAERFVADPFDRAGGGRLYRTGDLVRWRADGQLEYLGRRDQQVKIRGFRIEPGEVEAQLLAQPGVRAAAVIARRTGPTEAASLIAYVSPAPGATPAPTPAALRDALAQVLPDYMVPASIVSLDVLPLTPNGKLDRRALPEPATSAVRAYEAPEGLLEAQLAGLWAEALRVDRVGREDNFFELGGDSILSVKLAARARGAGIPLGPGHLFKHQTLAAVAGALARERGPAAVIPSLSPERRREPLPLSSAQVRQWFLWQLDPASTAYHIVSGLRLRGPVDAASIAAVMNELVERHEALRTVFRTGAGGQPEQVIRPHVRFDLPLVDLSAVTESERDGAVAAEARRVSDTPFDLTIGPLLRACLLRCGADEHVLVVAMHHIVSDGWSMQVLIDEFIARYDARRSGIGTDPTPPAAPYADYAVWQREWLDGPESRQQLGYWTTLLGGEQPVIQLPADHPRRAGRSRAARFEIELPEALALRGGGTLFPALLTAFQVLLCRYTGQPDIRIGVPTANRHHPGTENVVGLFVNTQVWRNRLDLRMGLKQALAQTRTMALEADAHQDLPFDQLVGALQPDRQLDVPPLFQVLFNHLRATAAATSVGEKPLSGLTYERYALAERDAQFELAVHTVEEADGRVRASFVYAADLFEADTIARMAAHYRAVLHALAATPDQAIGDVPLLTGSEQQALRQWGLGAERNEWTQPVHAAFEERVREQPHAPALAYGGRTLSYAELNARANRLAHRLISLGVRPDTPVGIAVERSFEMVVGLLAILKAGGAFVPIDPEYPADRVSYMLADSRIDLLLTQRDVRMHLPIAEGLRLIDLDTVDLDREAATNPDVPVHAETLAYVIYTSGSTGRPKGAANRHCALANRLIWMQAAYALEPEDVVLQKTPFSFDVSVWEFFWPLMYGARLAMAAPGDHRDPARLVALIRTHGVTTLHFVPSMLSAFAAYAPIATCESLRRVVCSGEALSIELQQAVRARLPHVALFNLYGPTEAAIDVTHWTCLDDGRPSVPIGRPIAGIETHVLDDGLHLTPPGVAGELYLGGVGLARGYLHRPGLTASRFVANPLDGRGGRLYRTGDRVRWSADGQLEYLGRLDHQIKIRGFRVELGEIEAQLLALPGVREAVVILRDGPQGARLVAYVAADAEDQEAAWREQLVQTLPEHMVPARIVTLPALPVTPNGKLDRRALPEPAWTPAAAYEPPQGEVETHVAAIWAEVLGVARVGRSDSFFALGGHSLLALHLLERLRQAGHPASVRTLFQHPELAAFVRALPERARGVAPLDVEAVSVSGIPPGCDLILPSMVPLATLDDAELRRIEASVPGGARNIQDIYPLAPLQEGILFHHVLQRRGDAYVTVRTLAFDSRQRLELFVNAFNQVIARHDILRTAIVWEGVREPVQVVYREAPLRIEWLEDAAPEAGTHDGDDVAARLAAYAHPSHYRIDVRRAPLIHAMAAPDPAAGRWLLQLPSHHLVLDHTTLDLVVREIMLIQEGRQHALARPVPFRQFVAQARSGVTRAEHEAFFRGMLGDVDEPTTPFNLLDVQGDGTRVRDARLPLEASLATRIRGAAQRRGVSAAALFHVAWALVLGRTSGRDDVVFGTVLFGRLQGGAGAERALGLFINTLPLRVRLGARRVDDCVRQTHEHLIGLMHHEHASLSLAQHASALPSGTPLFSALLNYRYAKQHRGSDTVPDAAWEGVELLAAQERTNYPFGMAVEDQGADGFTLSALIHESVDASQVCGLMQEAIRGVVQALETMPERLVCDLPLTTARDLRQLRDWGTNPTRYAGVSLVHRQFEQRAVEQPDAPALIFGDEELTYRELNERANRLAHHLVRLGVGPDAAVGVAVVRSIDMIVGLLGVLKSGAAYVPLDPEYPVDRLAYMIQDSGMRLLLTQRAVSERVRLPDSCAALMLDAVSLDHEPDTNLSAALHPEALAYVIYTSGSTGRPKGVAVAHGPLAMHVRSIGEAYGMTPRDRELQFASIAFDGAHERTWVPLCFGSVLMPRDSELWSAERTVAEMARHGITIACFTPSYLVQVAELIGTSARELPIRSYTVGGEPMPRAGFDLIQRVLAPPRVVNGYGPTETVITPTIAMASAGARFESRYMPIGRLVGDRTAYVVDLDMHLLPPGVPGELYLGGAGLARGYAGRPALTAERFVADPFGQPGARLYRTGDRVRWNADGELEYLGRVDHQVKIRGFRIELGEVEAQLLAQPDVGEAVAIVREGPSGTQLLAYVAPRVGQRIDGSELRARLAETLPAFMVPAAIVALPRLPVTPNGKVDRTALPPPELTDTRVFEPPRGEVEEQVAALWAQVLGVDRVGRTDDFFELGGHSLALLKVQSRIQHELGLQVPLRTYFEKTLLSDLCAVLALQRETALVEDSGDLDRMAALLDALER